MTIEGDSPRFIQGDGPRFIMTIEGDGPRFIIRPGDLKEWLDDYDENAKGYWSGAGAYRAS